MNYYLKWIKSDWPIRESNTLRHSGRLLLALTLAFIINYFYSMAHGFWLPLATLVVMLTVTGSAFYQGVKHFLYCILFVIIYSWITHSMQAFSWRISDVAIGAVIGISINVLVFHDLVDVEFRHRMIPIIKSYAEYFSALVKLLLQIEPNHIEEARIIVEKKLIALPAWVYETGFDMTLQKGHRYFTMKVTELYELLMAMQHVARYRYDPVLLDSIREPLLQCLVRVEQFFFALLTVLDLRKLTEGVVDFADEVEELEKQFRKTVPLTIDVIDVSKDYVYLAEFIYHLRDFRDAMLKLAQTLR